MRMKIAAFPFVILLFAGLCLLEPYQASLARGTSGSVQFAPPFIINSPITFPSGIAAGGFNNDGIPDLAVVGQTNEVICVALGKGDGTFGSWICSNTAGDTSTMVVTGKFDGQNLDAAIDGMRLGNAYAMLGSGDGNFPNYTFLNTNSSLAGGLAVGDFNGDHNEDLAVTDQLGHVYVFLGNGDGTFQSPQSFPTGGTDPTAVMVGDFNGDGKQDLAILNSRSGNTPGSVAVLLGIGNGQFESPRLFQLRPRNLFGFYFPSAIAAGYFNGDTNLDVAVAIGNFSSDRSSYIVVLLGNGDGTFRRGQPVGAGPNPTSIATADFNGDGKTDLVVANQPPGGPKGEISVLLGNGDGTFQHAAHFAVNADGPVQVIVADFNLDGKPDVATVNEDSSTISILLNTTPFPARKPAAATPPR
jgi:hypothetical protein